MPKRKDTKLTEIANRIAVARRFIDEQQNIARATWVRARLNIGGPLSGV
jgi:2-iminoacetate synthase ThiH